MFEASEADDWKTFYFMLGRFVRILLVVDPLPVETVDEMEDKAFGDDDENKDPFDGYTPFDDTKEDDYDPYADIYDDTTDWDDDGWNRRLR